MADYNNFSQKVDFYKFIPPGLVIWQETCFASERKFCRPAFVTDEGEKPDTYAGEMTHHSKRRLAKALHLLLEITEPRWIINPTTGKKFKFRLAFQTLTLSAPQQEHTDKDIKKLLLEPYLRIMRRQGLKNYIWKAEQQQNGNIHFHIITDFFTPYTNIRDTWNNLQAKIGYIDHFYNKHGHRDPNSTDVKAVTNEKTTVAYLQKYMLKKSDKNEQLRLDKDYSAKAKGKVWDCSQNLKIKNKTSDLITDDIYRNIQLLEKDNRVKIISEEFFRLYIFSASHRKKFFTPQQLSQYNQYIQQVKAG